MEPKYKIDYKDCQVFRGNIVFRIIALKDFSDVKAGDLGGYIESENNLSHDGNCWIYLATNEKTNPPQFSCVCEKAFVSEDATLHSRVHVWGNAQIKGKASLNGTAKIHDFAIVDGTSVVTDNFEVFGNAHISGSVQLRQKRDGTKIKSGKVQGNVLLSDNTIYRVSDTINDENFELIRDLAIKENNKPRTRKSYKRKQKVEQPENAFYLGVQEEFKKINSKPEIKKPELNLTIPEPTLTYDKSLKYNLVPTEKSTNKNNGEVIKLFQLRAIKSFNTIKEGDLGGYVENENNLDHDGDCWIDKSSIVIGTSKVSDNAKVLNNSFISDSEISISAVCSGVYIISSRVTDNARVKNGAIIQQNCVVYDDALIEGNITIENRCEVGDNVHLKGNIIIKDNVHLLGNTKIFKEVTICNNIKIDGYSIFSSEKAYIEGGYNSQSKLAYLHIDPPFTFKNKNTQILFKNDRFLVESN